MNKNIFSSIGIVLLIGIIFFSCKKSNTIAINSEAIPSKGALLSYYKTFDPQILKSGDEVRIKAYLDKKALVIYDYIKANYQDTICGISEGKSANIILGGLALAIHEQKNSGNNSLIRYQVSTTSTETRLLHCAVSVLTGYESIQKIFSGTASLMSATEIISILKGMLTRYVGYIGIAVTVYEFGNCMNWFN